MAKVVLPKINNAVQQRWDSNANRIWSIISCTSGLCFSTYIDTFGLCLCFLRVFTFWGLHVQSFCAWALNPYQHSQPRETLFTCQGAKARPSTAIWSSQNFEASVVAVSHLPAGSDKHPERWRETLADSCQKYFLPCPRAWFVGQRCQFVALWHAHVNPTLPSFSICPLSQSQQVVDVHHWCSV